MIITARANSVKVGTSEGVTADTFRQHGLEPQPLVYHLGFDGKEFVPAEDVERVLAEIGFCLVKGGKSR